MEEVVRSGYDAIADTYLAHRDRSSNLKYLDILLKLLPPGAHVLDVGCGTGVPAALYLIARGCAVTGIDISERQIELEHAGFRVLVDQIDGDENEQYHVLLAEID